MKTFRQFLAETEGDHPPHSGTAQQQLDGKSRIKKRSNNLEDRGYQVPCEDNKFRDDCKEPPKGVADRLKELAPRKSRKK